MDVFEQLHTYITFIKTLQAVRQAWQWQEKPSKKADLYIIINSVMFTLPVV